MPAQLPCADGAGIFHDRQDRAYWRRAGCSAGRSRRSARPKRAALLQVAAGLAAKYPRLVFRNPEKVTQGWELARKQRALFIEFFGSDLMRRARAGGGIPDERLSYLLHPPVLEEADSEASSLDADVAAPDTGVQRAGRACQRADRRIVL